MEFTTLLQQLQSNDKNEILIAYRMIYQEWKNPVSGVLNKLGCKQKGDFLSCFNDGFMLLKKNVRNKQITATNLPGLKSYFISICKNYWLNKYELNPMKNNLVEVQDENVNETTPESGTKTMEPKVQSFVKQLLGRISERCKERILYSKYFSADKKKIDMSAEEIATEMNYSSPRAATKALNKCMDQLRQKVAEEIARNPAVKAFLLEQLGIRMAVMLLLCFPAIPGFIIN